MLCCVFHPTAPMRVVEEDERDELLKTGLWFNSPADAKVLKKRCEDKIKEEDESNEKRNGKDVSKKGK